MFFKENDYLSLNSTNSIRGILTLLIIIHHAYQYKYREVVPQLIGGILQNMGFWCVAIFFFLSGYALTYSLKNKNKYMNSFVKKKILPIIISYAIFTIIYLVFFKIKENQFQLFGLWFIEALIYMYILFYFSFRKKENYIILWIGIIAYFALCFLLNKGINWYATILCFPLGIYWYNKRNIIDSYFNKHIIAIIFTIILFVITFLLSKIDIITFKLLKDFVFIVSNVLFVILSLEANRIIRLNCKILVDLGKYSLEIYAMQFSFLFSFIKIDGILYLVIVMILSIFFGIIVNHINKKVINLCIKEN